MRRFIFALCLSTFALCPLTLDLAAQAQLSREQQAEFLRTARIVKAAPIGKGVTRPFRLTLASDTLTHDAAFQSVDQKRAVSHGTGPGRRNELNFIDSWRFNIAAPRLAELLGIGDMIPVSVERSWDGKRGAVTWWVDDVLMDDGERRKTKAEAPDRDEWNRQVQRMQVFVELVYDTDRNQGNNLITKDWRLVMIDFTRAFRGWNQTPNPTTILRRCDRNVLASMRGLTKQAVKQAVGDHLTTFEVDALLARRDIIVKHFESLIAQFGEGTVLY